MTHAILVWAIGMTGWGGRAAAIPAPSADSVLAGYVRYQNPSQCNQAVQRMVQRYWRDKRPDTAVYAPLHTTLPQSGVDSARMCAARFAVRSLPPSQLPAMLSLAIWAEQPTLITQVMHRLREPAPALSAEMRAQVIRKAGEAFLHAEPANLDSAVVLRDLLRALEPGAGIDELLLTNEITDFAMHLGRRNAAAASAQYGIALQQAGHMTAADRTDYVLFLILAQLRPIQLAMRQPGMTSSKLYDMFDSAVTAVRHVSGSSPLGIAGKLFDLRKPYEMFGAQAVPIRSAYLYGDTTAPLPRPGAVSLIYTGAIAAQGTGGVMSSNAVLRRIQVQFASQPFGEVYLTSTHGWFMTKLMTQPSQEAELTRKYFLDYQHLPATLAIERSYFNTQRTGLRRPEPAINQQFYQYVNNYVNCEIVGKDGKVKFFGWLSPETERTFVAAIKDALEEKIVTTGTGASNAN